jgi:hypothetical protein
MENFFHTKLADFDSIRLKGVRFKVMWLCLGATSKSPLTPLFQRGE